MIKVGKRDNNKKRNFLLVNTKLGKHIPVKPITSLDIFDTLGERVQESLSKDAKILCIGFAETATALGIEIARQLDSYYIQTTRRKTEDEEWFDFSEEHSHATQQLLSKTEIEGIIGTVDNIVFIDDEITTGNTVRKIINIFKENYPTLKLNFTVASLINNMPKSDIIKDNDKGICYVYLESHLGEDYESKVNDMKLKGNYITIECNSMCMDINRIKTSILDTRKLVKIEDYIESCNLAYLDLTEQLNLYGRERILMLGTEELMYPAIYIGNKLGEIGCRIKCHSTTRSPICTDRSVTYPLHSRYALRSVYEDRTTFIYDLDSYDKVIIVTDGKNKNGLRDLLLALKMNGNMNNVYLLQIDYKES